MLIPIEGGGQINRNAIAKLHADANGGCSALLANGEEVTLLYSEEMIAAMDGVVLPASDGFAKLVYRFIDQVTEQHPVIGWRVVGIEPPLPITPQQDGTHDPETVEGVRYPDGQIIVGRDLLFDGRPSFADYCNTQRIEWLKTNDPRTRD